MATSVTPIPDEQSARESTEEESARTKLEEVKRYAWSLIIKLYTLEEIRAKIRKQEAKKHTPFE